MRTSTAILAVSTALLVITAGYLGRELGATRAEADESNRLAQYLSKRVVELERARAAPAVQPGAEGRAALGRSTAASPAAPTHEADAADRNATAQAIYQSAADRPKTAAAQRIQRSQARANAKRMYADFAAEYGLSPEDAARLYELMAEHDAGYSTVDASGDVGALEADWRERDRKFREQANALLGQDGADRLNRYQGSFSARAQIAELEDQLGANDMPLTEEQRKRLTRAAIQDGEQFPLPTFTVDQGPEQLSQAYLTWERDRKERLAAAARTILDSQQMRYFDDLRQYEQETGQQGQ